MDERTWLNTEDRPDMIFFCVDPLCPQKRLRVWTTQQLEDTLEILTPFNYLTEYARYMRGCDNLSRCFPNHNELGHIDEIKIEFQRRYDEKVNTIIKPAIKKIYKMQVKEDLKRLRML